MIFDYEASLAVLIITAILFVIIFLKEILRKNRNRLVLRGIAVVLLFLGITGLLNKPTYLSTTINKAVILTDNFDQNVIDSLEKANENIELLQLDQLELDELNEVFLLGEGLESYDFEFLNTLKVNFIPSNLPFGINQIEYTDTQTQSKAFTIQGECNCLPENKIVIEGPEGRVDSVQNSANFEFEVKSKVIGRQLYYLEYWEDTVLVERNPVPVVVQAPEQLNVLILNSFPTFESNHIKQFLDSKNHAVIVRNRVSENRFSYEFVNTNRTELSTLSSKVLQQMDLVILDQKEWLTLSNIDRKLLVNEVNNGLGILLHGIYSNTFSKSLFADFDVKEITSNDVDGFIYEGSKFTSTAFSFTKSEMLFSFSTIDSERVSAYQIKGRGKVAVMLVTDTYRMNFRGEEDAYASFWSNHIDKISKNKSSVFRVSFKPRMVWINDPMDIRLITMENDIPNVKIDSTKVNLKQSVIQDEIWSGKYWSERSGWHQISKNDETNDFYVFDTNGWKSLRVTQKIRANRRQFSNQLIDEEQKYSKKQIPLYYPFLLFLIGVGYLWIESKL